MIHPKTLLISRHFYSLESYIWRSIYNLKIDTISTYDIPLDRSFLKLWNSVRHVMPSTDRRLELKEKTSMAQNAWQAFVYANGLICLSTSREPVNGRHLLVTGRLTFVNMCKCYGLTYWSSVPQSLCEQEWRCLAYSIQKGSWHWVTLKVVWSCGPAKLC